MLSMNGNSTGAVTSLSALTSAAAAERDARRSRCPCLLPPKITMSTPPGQRLPLRDTRTSAGYVADPLKLVDARSRRCRARFTLPPEMPLPGVAASYPGLERPDEGRQTLVTEMKRCSTFILKSRLNTTDVDAEFRDVQPSFVLLRSSRLNARLRAATRRSEGMAEMWPAVAAVNNQRCRATMMTENSRQRPRALPPLEPPPSSSPERRRTKTPVQRAEPLKRLLEGVECRRQPRRRHDEPLMIA